MSGHTPLLSNFFALELEGIMTSKFFSCTGLETETYTYEVEEGGFGIHKFLGRTRYPNIILEVGFSSENELYQWYIDTVQSENPVERKSGSIILMQLDGQEVKRWNFSRGLPCRWIGPSFESRGYQNVAIEKFEIAYEELWLESGTVERTKTAINNNVYEEYKEGTNDCDIWARDILNEADVINNPIVNPEGRDVPTHSNNMTGGTTTPSEGVNVHIKDDHISIVIKEDDTYTVAHQGDNNYF